MGSVTWQCNYTSLSTMGDEGKGKWIDILAHDTDLVALIRQNNAGHTLYVDGEKVVLHQIPSGIFQKPNCYPNFSAVIN